MDCMVRLNRIESVKCQIGGQVIWLKWLLLFLLIKLAIVHAIDFHDIPFAKIIALSHDRVTGKL